MAGGGGSQPDATTYPTYLKDFHEGLIGTGVFDPQMNIAEEMWRASSSVGGSPYGRVQPYDPTTDITELKTFRDALFQLVSSMDPSSNLTTDLTTAQTHYDTNLLPSSEIDAVVDAAEARSLTPFQRDISGALDYAASIGALNNSQLAGHVRKIVKDRRNDSFELDAKLRLFAQRDRTQAVIAIANAIAAERGRQFGMIFQAHGMNLELMRIIVSSQQDAIGLALEYEARDALWDFNLVLESAQIIAAIQGAATMPRNLTKNERLMASIGSSINAGIQGGTTFGNPAIGVGIGLGSLGIQLLAGLGE